MATEVTGQSMPLINTSFQKVRAAQRCLPGCAKTRHVCHEQIVRLSTADRVETKKKEKEKKENTRGTFIQLSFVT